MKKVLIFALGLSALASVARAQDQQPVCTGHPAVVRISKLSPTGTMAGLAKAAADHQAWYNTHGSPQTRVLLAPVTSSSAGETDVVTLNIDPPPYAKRAPADDAWTAFIKEYDDNSIVVLTGLTCMTDDEAKSKAAAQAK
jgi:hypothetical protein